MNHEILALFDSLKKKYKKLNSIKVQKDVDYEVENKYSIIKLYETLITNLTYDRLISVKKKKETIKVFKTKLI